jgi:hypothetical protein
VLRVHRWFIMIRYSANNIGPAKRGAAGMRVKSKVRWVFVALFLLAVLWFVSQLQGQYFSQGVPVKEVPALVNEYRRTWAQILGGAALLLGLYVTWRTLQVNREGQITERFTRAIDQLGSKELEIRLGAIYALERIAKDSKRDHWPIMEILTAYVRKNSPGEREATPTKVPADEGPPLEPDIQAIITVLRRRTLSFSAGEPEPLDLQGTNLR